MLTACWQLTKPPSQNFLPLSVMNSLVVAHQFTIDGTCTYLCRCAHATVNCVGCLSWSKGGVVLRWLWLLFLAPHPPLSSDALEKNQELEFERNKERFLFLKWGAKALKNMLIVPPGSGIVHQVKEVGEVGRWGRWGRWGGG